MIVDVGDQECRDGTLKRQRSVGAGRYLLGVPIAERLQHKQWAEIVPRYNGYFEPCRIICHGYQHQICLVAPRMAIP